MRTNRHTLRKPRSFRNQATDKPTPRRHPASFEPWRNFLKLVKDSKKALDIQAAICKSLGLSCLVKVVCVNICTGGIHVHASAVPLLGTNRETLLLLAASYITFRASVAASAGILFFFIIFSIRPQSATDSTDFCNDSN